MIAQALSRLFKNSSDADLSRWQRQAKAVGAWEPQLLALSDAQLREHALGARQRCAARFQSALGADPSKRADAKLTELLIEVFALTREASRRVLGLRHYDAQLIGGFALYEGQLAEMRTGEGKTLVIPLAATFSAYCGLQAHVVTVNEYLASRDAAQMGKIYQALGLEVGLLQEGQDDAQRQEQYARPIVYGVNHEFGFDYLRDNMALSLGERRQRELGFAIVDEVDSILIDEARTPLIITGQRDAEPGLYEVMTRVCAQLSAEDMEIDKKMGSVSLTEQGFAKVELMLLEVGLLERAHHLYEPKNGAMTSALQACLQASHLYTRDTHYIVREGQVVIVDENTGRLMPDRRWGHGLHQAVEAKEGVEVRPETKTLGQITYQNFFRLYKKLAGLTGTAMTQKEEFGQIYGLRCAKIPTNRPMIRKDEPDAIYRTKPEKFDALAKLAQEQHGLGRPVLLGAATVEDSEILSGLLNAMGVRHELLNAKNHQREAQIIAMAGAPGSVTVSTNMAGRGTDIVLGGNPELMLADASASAQALGLAPEQVEQARQSAMASWESRREQVVSLGGLLVLGSGRHESRRVDNQLRGRAGRQGDPGSSKFIISLDDDLFRIYGQRGFIDMIDRMKLMPNGSALESPMLGKALDRAQASVESHHFNSRKQILDYDNVSAEQRRAIYSWRDEILTQNQAPALLEEMLSQALEERVGALMPEESLPEQWDKPEITRALKEGFRIEDEGLVSEWLERSESGAEVLGHARAIIEMRLRALKASYGETWTLVATRSLLSEVDGRWQEHLGEMAALMDGIHLRGYAQKDPKQEYRREAFEMFARMRDEIGFNVARRVSFMEPFDPFSEGVGLGEAGSAEQDEAELKGEA